MPSNHQPLGALPARFRRERLLIVGCGDVGMRVLRTWGARSQVLALTSTPARVAELRAAGAKPLVANLDETRSLRRLAGLATRLLHLAPPAREEGPGGRRDRRTQHLLRSLQRGAAPAALIYGSTSGVYGHCDGQWVPESRPCRPTTARAQRRVDAEQHIRRYGRSAGVRVSVLRIPGIYAPDREGGTPRARLLRGTPVLRAEEDVFTNHIHADDLARACLLALFRGAPQRAFNVCDQTQLKMGDYFDLAADLYGLPRPPRVSWTQAQQQLGPMQLSFMAESRRLSHERLKNELRLRLRYPTVREGLAAPARRV